MSIALVVNTKASGNSGGAGPTSAIDTTGATLLVVNVAHEVASSGVGVTDSKGNTYVALTTYSGVAGKTTIFYCKAPTVGTGHTFTVSGTSAYASMEVSAWSGTDQTANADGDNGGSNSGTTVQPGSLLPSQNGSLIIFAGNLSGAGTISGVDSGFTLLDQSPLVGGSADGSFLAYKIQSTAASVNPTASASGSMPMSAAITSFKAASGGPLTVSTPSPLPSVQVGTAWSGAFAESGGTGPFTWSHGSGLPTGGSIDSSGNRSGTLTVLGTYTFNVTVTDSLSAPDTKSFTISVVPSVIDINPASLNLLDGDVVSGFTDDAGVEWEFVGAGPVYKYVNGVPVLRFDGSTTGLKTAGNLDLSAFSKIDAFCRFKSISVVGSADIIYEHGTSLVGDQPSLFAFTNGSSQAVAGEARSGGDNYWTTSELFTSTPKLLHAQIDTSLGGSTETIVNVDGSATGGTHTASADTSGNFGNKVLYVGGRTGSSLQANFDLYRLRIVGGGMTSGERTAATTEIMSPTVRDKILVCVGDSLFTTYLGTTSSPRELAGLLGSAWQVFDQAIPGQEANAVNTNFSTQVTAFMGGPETTKWVLMRGGINDLAVAGKTPSQTHTILGTFVTNVHGLTGVKAAVCGLTGIGATEEAAFPGLNAARQSLNTLLRASGGAGADLFIDLVTLAPSLDDGDDSTYFLTDTIHMTTAGRVLEGETIYGEFPAELEITTSSPLATLPVGSAWTGAFANTGGTGPFTWSHGSGLPVGGDIDSTGNRSGTLTTAGTYTFNVTVTDSLGNTATKSFTISVDFSEFPSDVLTGIRYFHYLERPRDYISVTDTYEYEDAGMDFNERSSNPPYMWDIEFKHRLSKAQTDIFDAFWDAKRMAGTFDFTDKYGTTWTGVRIKEYSRSHQANRSWDRTVRFVLVKYP